MALNEYHRKANWLGKDTKMRATCIRHHVVRCQIKNPEMNLLLLFILIFI